MANRHKFMTKQQRSTSGVKRAENVYGNKEVISAAKKRKDGGAVPGRAQGGRLDRKSGGSVGKSPFSSAGGGKADKSPFFK